MNRTDRLYALVEELRALAPRPRSASWLAARFEVSTRTIERDIAALQQSGTPIYAETGRAGGYVLDRARSLPPLNVTPHEAVAVAAGLHALSDTPFAEAARSALHKVLAVMPERDVVATRELAARVQLIAPQTQPGRVPRTIQEALTARRVLSLDYADRDGVSSRRLVEPLGFLGGTHWYLLGWCRLRSAVRGFRLDRIQAAEATDEPAPIRDIDLAGIAAGHAVRDLDVT